VKNNWHKTTGWSLDEFMNRLGKFVFWNHIGGCFTKMLVVGEDINPEDPLAVTYAFAGRNHPERGVWYFPDSPFYGVGTEAYHTMEDYLGRVGGYEEMVPARLGEPVSGSGCAIYSCLGTEKNVEQPRPGILTFQRHWPKDIQEKVMANWEKWGFRAPDRSQKHATPLNQWVYFNNTGEDETEKGA
jgi:4-hydroxy-3-polyprenylbenzoate decarboxylase